MKIYLAGRYARLKELKRYAVTLEKAGHTVTARWLDGDEEGKTQEQIAMMDWEDVVKAEMVIAFTDPYGSLNKGGGRHTEFGMGYALKKHCWIVGQKEQVFHSLIGVRQFFNMRDVVNALDAMHPRKAA